MPKPSSSGSKFKVLKGILISADSPRALFVAWTRRTLLVASVGWLTGTGVRDGAEVLHEMQAEVLRCRAVTK